MDSNIAAYIHCVGKTQCQEALYKALHPLVDNSLCREYASMRKKGLAITTFLTANKDAVCFLVPESDVDAILGATDSWASVGPQMKAIAAATRLGELLFERVPETLDSVSMVAGGAVRHHCCAVSGLARADRVAEGTWLGKELAVRCESTMMEIDLRLDAIVKGRLLGHELPLLSFEKWVFELEARDPDFVVEEGVYKNNAANAHSTCSQPDKSWPVCWLMRSCNQSKMCQGCLRTAA
eukprot:6033165-Amphidinium_carterae.3